jgi:hypothetical protein
MLANLIKLIVRLISASGFVLHNLLILFREQYQPQLPPGHTDEWYNEQVQLLDMGEIQQERGRNQGQAQGDRNQGQAQGGRSQGQAQGGTFRVRDHVIENFF